MQDQQEQAKTWFESFQRAACARFEALEAQQSSSSSPVFFSRPSKTRSEEGTDRGGGIMSLLKGGSLFEKVGVNVSTVYGILDKKGLDRLAAGKSVSGLEKDPRYLGLWCVTCGASFEPKGTGRSLQYTHVLDTR